MKKAGTIGGKRTKVVGSEEALRLILIRWGVSGGGAGKSSLVVRGGGAYGYACKI